MNSMIEDMISNVSSLLEELESGPHSDYDTWFAEHQAAHKAFAGLCELRTAMYHNQPAEGTYAVCGDGTFHNLTDMSADEVEAKCDGDWLILPEGMTVGQVARLAISHGCDHHEVWSQIVE